MKPKRWWPGLIPLTFLWLAAIWVETKPVEQYLASQAAEAAKALPLHKVRVAAAGRDITLSGETFSEHKQHAAPAALAAVWGIRQAQVATQLIPEAKPFSWSATRTDDEVVLAGSVPSPDARTNIINEAQTKIRGRAVRIVYRVSHAMRAKVGGVKIVDRMTYARGGPEGFDAMARLGLAQLGRLDDGKLIISDAKVSISGSAGDERTRSAVVAALGRLPPGFTLAANSITVPDRKPSELKTDAAVAAAPAEPPADAPACQQQFNDVLANDTIQFAQNSADIDPDSFDLLRNLVEIATRCQSSNIDVIGHTDSIGTNQYNVDLSRRRAQSVVDYLVDAGLDPSRLTAAGFGSSKPIVPNTTREGRARNRRIEFLVR